MIDYRKNGLLINDGIMVPSQAPTWMHDRKTLWDAVDLLNPRPDAKLAWELTMLLPTELDENQMPEAVTDFLKSEFVVKGHVCDYAIHAPSEADLPYYHAHVLVTANTANRGGVSWKDGAHLSVPDNCGKLEAAWHEELLRLSSGDLIRLGHPSFVVLPIQRSFEYVHPIALAAPRLEHAANEPEAENVNRDLQAQHAELQSMRKRLAGLTDRLHAAGKQIEQQQPLVSGRTQETDNTLGNVERTSKPKSRGWDLER